MGTLQNRQQFIFAVIAAPGVIEHRLLGRIAFGEMDGRRTPRAERVLAALQKAEIPAELSAAENSLTGMETSPKEMLAVPIARALMVLPPNDR